MGKWNSTANICYQYFQLTFTCFVIDLETYSYPLIAGYEDFKCNGQNANYTQYSSMKWTGKSGEPGLADLKEDVLLAMRVARDPFVETHLAVDLSYNPDSSSMKIGGIFVIVISFFGMLVPLFFFVNLELPPQYKYKTHTKTNIADEDDSNYL